MNAGDVSPSVPVTVCGNGVGVLGDASASCAPGQPAAPSGGSTGTGSTGTSAGTGDATSDSLLGSFASGNQVDAGIGDISPSVPVTVCGNGVGVLGDASAGCGTGQPATSTGGASAGASGSTQADGTLAGNQAEVSVGDVAATVPVTASCNSVGLLGDASSNCGTSTSPGTDPGTDTGIDRHRDRHRDRGRHRGQHRWRDQHRGDHRPAAGDHLPGWGRHRRPRVDRDLGDPRDPWADPGLRRG